MKSIRISYLQQLNIFDKKTNKPNFDLYFCYCNPLLNNKGFS
jgi:hypothetical protein